MKRRSKKRKRSGFLALVCSPISTGIEFEDEVAAMTCGGGELAAAISALFPAVVLGISWCWCSDGNQSHRLDKICIDFIARPVDFVSTTR